MSRDVSRIRILSMLAVVVALVACSNQRGEATPRPTGTVASTVGEPTGPASPGCQDAFAALAEMDELGRPRIDKLVQLGDLSDEVLPTVEGCDSVADWIAGAQPLVTGEVNPNTAALLLRIQCEDQSLADTPICQEI